ncbi:MAG: HDIG domain-containing protein [Flavobacteriaceae bacterium]|nr:HDIG domain-containing protein [Flavobacteriaceae bacterium]
MNKIFNFFYINKALIYKIFFYIVSSILILYLFPKEAKFKYEIKKGSSWIYDSLYSPFDFAILKSNKEIEDEKRAIQKNSRVYFDLSEDVYKNTMESYNNKFEMYFSFSDSLEDYSRYFDFGIKLIDEIYSRGVLPVNYDSKINNISIIRKNSEEELDINELFNINNLSSFIDKKLLTFSFEDPNKKYYNLFFDIISPNLTLNKNFTEKSLNELLLKISPTRDIIVKGEMIIAKGEVIESDKFQKLISLKNQYSSEVYNESNYRYIFFGYSMLVFLSLLMLFLFIRKYYNSIYRNNREFIFVVFNIILMIYLTTTILNFESKYLYAAPICILPLVIKSFFDARLGLFAHFLTILLLGFIVPNSFEYIFLQFLVGIVTILSVSDLYIRANLFIVVFQIVIVYVISYFAFHIIHEGTIKGISLLTLGLFIINGLATLFVQPLLYLYERTFRLVSDVSLLELSDTNSKLLKELSNDAPGTFYHSLQVANLAEAAASEINGNVLLTRVGALYHDIGKLKDPTFFSENQTTKTSPHSRISPAESAEIIINHVKYGIQLAKKNKLPDRIIDFIRTHHGTSKVYYFYKKEQKRNQNIDDTLFHYEGPKPFSKETAILMMSDSVEAASKSLKEPTIENLNLFVNEIIDNQMIDKQFSNSNITFSEIEKVKQILINKLINIYHLRVEYPEK